MNNNEDFIKKQKNTITTNYMTECKLSNSRPCTTFTNNLYVCINFHFFNVARQ